MMKLDPGQHIFNDPEVAVWSGIGIALAGCIWFVIEKPHMWFVAILAFVVAAPYIAYSLYKFDFKTDSDGVHGLLVQAYNGGSDGMDRAFHLDENDD
jgi:hypothetical protein